MNKCNITMLGYKNTGKTTFRHIIFYSDYNDSYKPSKKIKQQYDIKQINNRPVKMDICDIPFSKIYSNNLRYYYKYCDSILIFADYTNMKSFVWAAKIKNALTNKYNGQIILVVTKSDNNPEIRCMTEDKLWQFSDEHQFTTCFIVSLLERKYINAIIEYVIIGRE